MMRYWFASAAISNEAQRLGRPLQIVDLGCERGITQAFCDHIKDAHWTGLDWAPREKSLSLAAYHEIKQANFDEPLPLPDNSADVLVCLHVFEHLPRPDFTITEIARVLKPGGLFIGATPVKPLGLIARFRTGRLRKEMADGKRKVGKHMNAFAIPDWLELVSTAGMNAISVCGGHFFRWQKNPLENMGWWVRLNQLWGALFPWLGGEIFIQARKADGSPTPRKNVMFLPRMAATASMMAFLGLSCLGVFDLLHLSPEEWMARHQDGNDHFYVHIESGLDAKKLGAVNYSNPLELLPMLVLDRDKKKDSHFIMPASEAELIIKDEGWAGLTISDYYKTGKVELALVESKR